MAELQREEITARIKQARKEAGLSQPEMAELIEVADRTYQNYEATRVPWGLIGKIAEVTGRDSKWLLHGDNPVASEPTADLIGALEARDSQLDRIESKLDELTKQLARIEFERELETTADRKHSPSRSSDAATPRRKREG